MDKTPFRPKDQYARERAAQMIKDVATSLGWPNIAAEADAVMQNEPVNFRGQIEVEREIEAPPYGPYSTLSKQRDGLFGRMQIIKGLVDYWAAGGRPPIHTLELIGEEAARAIADVEGL
jgi:hypothetical protein